MGVRGVYGQRHGAARGAARGIDYVSATVGALLDGRDSPEVHRAAQQALAADHRLDDALRQFLAERVTARDRFGDLATLMVGATRMRRIGYVMRTGSALMPLSDGAGRVERARGAVEAELDSLRRWFAAFGTALRTGGRPPAPQPSHDDAERAVLARISNRGRPDLEDLAGALSVAWALHDLYVARSVEGSVAPALERLTDPRTAGDGQPVI
jgi:hypothetical protein